MIPLSREDPAAALGSRSHLDLFSETGKLGKLNILKMCYRKVRMTGSTCPEKILEAVRQGFETC